ncbi:O-methyltransferase [Acrasis kona]|uniref:O-methyltransferase n=1 Tax=Acrasis kona TaxID=1008807 RepID=A0AAW2YXE3_9EUKA
MTKISSLVSEEVVHYVRAHSGPEIDILRRLREETAEKTQRFSGMVSSPEQQQLMKIILKLYGAKKCIELGTFTGYSALCTALTIPEDGIVIACDVSEEWTSIGKKYWKEAGVDHKIDLRLAPGTETLDALLEKEAGTFDYAFIDADKVGYDSYYERCLKLVRKNGLIAIDNVLWSGKVLDESVNDDDTVALKALNEKIKSDDRVEVAMTTISDGVTFLLVK